MSVVTTPTVTTVSVPTHVLTPVSAFDQNLQAMFQKLGEAYKPADDVELSPDEKSMHEQSAKQSMELLSALIEHHLRPIYNNLATQVARLGSPVAAAGSSGLPVATPQPKPKRKLSDWQIFLKYAKEIIPGYTESTSKMSLAKDAYKAYSAEQRTALRTRFYADNPSAMPSTTASTATTAPQKKGGQNGWTLFSKNWYADQKRLYPERKGLQSEACGAAWKALTDAERGAWNLKGRQGKTAQA